MTGESGASAIPWPSHDGCRSGHSCRAMSVTEASADASHRKALDLQRRIDRTTAYLRELGTGSLDSTTRLVVDATLRSLITPSPSSDEATS